jgi:GT2 family glycosyltransferase
MRKDLFEKLGGFDERFFLFFEDTDLCRRIKNAGFEVWYCPDSVFTHTKKRLSESDWPGGWLFKKAFWIHVWSALKYFRKYNV